MCIRDRIQPGKQSAFAQNPRKRHKRKDRQSKDQRQHMLEARPFPLEHLHRIPEQKPQQDINSEQQQKRKHKRRTDKEQERRGAVVIGQCRQQRAHAQRHKKHVEPEAGCHTRVFFSFYRPKQSKHCGRQQRYREQIMRHSPCLLYTSRCV